MALNIKYYGINDSELIKEIKSIEAELEARRKMKIKKKFEQKKFIEPSEYKGDLIDLIPVSSKGLEVIVPNDELIFINDEGFIEYSSYNGGIIKFDKKENSFYKHFYMTLTKLDIIGFVKI